MSNLLYQFTHVPEHAVQYQILRKVNFYIEHKNNEQFAQGICTIKVQVQKKYEQNFHLIVHFHNFNFKSL